MKNEITLQTRRHFLRTTVLGSALTWTVPAFLASPPPNLSGFVAAAHACLNHDTSAAAAQISQPTLVIAGTFDILTRPLLSERLADRLPRAVLRKLPTGHMVFWEMPDAFNALVREFVT